MVIQRLPTVVDVGPSDPPFQGRNRSGGPDPEINTLTKHGAADEPEAAGPPPGFDPRYLVLMGWCFQPMEPTAGEWFGKLLAPRVLGFGGGYATAVMTRAQRDKNGQRVT
jgi:hypothetical protein